MRCPVSDRHSDEMVAKLVGLHGWQVNIKARGTCLNHQSRLYMEGGLMLNMGCRRPRKCGMYMESVGWWWGGEVGMAVLHLKQVGLSVPPNRMF